jgi:UPF0271 protein
VEALVGESRDSGQEWTLVALAGSVLTTVAREHGLKVVGEAFADRSYRRDGTLTPRSEPGSVIGDVDLASRQALQIAAAGTVTGSDGTDIQVDAGTICLHGDGPSAVDFARRIRRDFKANGITVLHF